MGDSELVGGEQLTAEDVAAYMLKAGFDPQQAATMVAISKNESHYDAGILNDNAGTGDYSVGLTQINYRGTGSGQYSSDPTQWPLWGRVKEFGTPQQLASSPAAEAAASYTLFKQAGGYSPWQADFNSGVVSTNLPEGEAAVQAALAAGVVPTSPGTGTPGTSTGGLPGSGLGGLLQGGEQVNAAPPPTSTFDSVLTSTDSTNSGGGFLQTFDKILNPSSSLNPFSDVGHAITMAIVRGSLALIGIVMVGAGLFIIANAIGAVGAAKKIAPLAAGPEGAAAAMALT